MAWVSLDNDQMQAIFEISKGSDRVVAVVGGAMLDNHLRQALELHLRLKDGNTDMNEKLFRVNGPLGNLSPKIDLAYQLWMIDKVERNTMHGITTIRNRFAHEQAISFSSTDKKLIEAFDKLTLHEDKTHYTTRVWPGTAIVEIGPVETLKHKFIANLRLSLLTLIADHDRHKPWTNIAHDPETEGAPDYSASALPPLQYTLSVPNEPHQS